MKASFVIVNYNRKDELLITINKTKQLIAGYKEDYEIVIVDNGSTDGSAHAVAAAHPDIVLLANKMNTGAPAWNGGFDVAKGDYFIIIDDDSHVESGLEDALYYMDAQPQIGVLALNVLTGPYTSKGWNMQEGKNIIGFIGCGAVLRRETYKKVGGYADWIFLYVNEWDYGIRCTNAGYNVQYFENCKVTHRTSSINRTSKRLTVLVTKHELGIVYKHFAVDRWKYIRRILLNRLKVVKGLNFKEAYWCMLGASQFMKMKNSLTHTPVALPVQELYIKTFPGTQEPAFGFINNLLKSN
jgi:GT2 family glycosyltransferase